MKINDIVMEKTEDPRSEVKRREQFRTGGGTHKDRKKAAKRGDAKHKKQAVPTEGVAGSRTVKESTTVEVSVRDARKANDIAKDMFRGEYKMDGSNSFVFKNADAASDFRAELSKQNILEGISDHERN